MNEYEKLIKLIINTDITVRCDDYMDVIWEIRFSIPMSDVAYRFSMVFDGEEDFKSRFVNAARAAFIEMLKDK